MLHHRASSHDMNSVLGQTRTEKCHQLQTTGRSCCGFTCRTFLGSLKRTNSLLTRRKLQQSQAQGEQPSPVTGWSEGRKTLLRTRCRDKADTCEPNLFRCSTVKSYNTPDIFIKQNCGWVDVISKGQVWHKGNCRCVLFVLSPRGSRNLHIKVESVRCSLTVSDQRNIKKRVCGGCLCLCFQQLTLSCLWERWSQNNWS